MSTASTYLVFGDLHGRVLPAFRLASAWARDHETPLAGILQVGDLGYFPDISRLDKATVRHAKDDPLELGVLDVVQPSEWADQIFAEPTCPPGLWFTAGNHEDFGELERFAQGHAHQPDFPVDHYRMVNGIQDGEVAPLAGGVRVAAVWGIDGVEESRRKRVPNRAYIRENAVHRLAVRPFDVLLCHDAPFGAKRPQYGSRHLEALVEVASPRFVFFGHYKGEGRKSDVWFGGAEVYHLAGFELRGRDGTAEPGSVGVLRWADGRGEFDYLDPAWRASFTRHNWRWR